MTVNLREYQTEALEIVVQEFNSGTNRQLIVLPTGAGKTIVMAAIAKHLNRRTLLLAHREELIIQAVDKFSLLFPDIDIGICMAEKDDIGHQIVIGSVQSCSRPKRLERLRDQGFDLLFIDEAHHSASDSYQTVIRELGFADDPSKLLIGVTATPRRGDSKGLDSTFQRVTYSRSISTMIRAGYLSPVFGRKILTNLNLERIRTFNGDFALEDLAEAVNNPARNEFIVDKFKSYAIKRKAIAFCVDVAHCKALAEAFNQQGIRAEAVWGDMETDMRRKVLDDLKHGRIQIATSCGVLCEGYDETSIDCIIMARPTKSNSLYTQCVGRGLRLHPGKENCLVLDFTDKGNNLDSVLTLSSAVPEATIFTDGEEREATEIDRTRKICALDELDEQFDILGNARFSWIEIGDGEWSLLDDERHEIIMKPEERGFVAIHFRPLGAPIRITKKPLPLEYCMGVCEDYARRNLKVAFANLNAAWLRDVPATRNQIEYLHKKGIQKIGMTKAEASVEIRRIVAMSNKKRRMMDNEPATPNQIFLLKRNGIKTDGLTKYEAYKIIARIKEAENTSKV